MKHASMAPGPANLRNQIRSSKQKVATNKIGSRLGQHPTTVQSQRADLLQPVSLPGSQLGRAVRQQDQALAPGRDALRQACGELPRIRPACFYSAMAARQ